MKTILVLLGVRGAGKTTVIEKLNERKIGRFLVPSTTRPKRHAGEGEYNFLSQKDWEEETFAWEIEISGEKYGVSERELAEIEGGDVGFTVFDPGNFDAFVSVRNLLPYEFITIGLDTVDTVVEQRVRVDNDPSREMLATEFELQRKVVGNADVVLSGDAEAVEIAVEALLKILGKRGGVLDKVSIEALVNAGALLKDVVANNLEVASYDLRLGDEVWCQGKLLNLNKDNPTLKIPPYSYAIVSAREIASLPRFVSGKFDLSVSLFFQGVVLSNGPQVDPGYHGALFCMLYNGSDSPVGITRGHKFATMEFVLTAFVTEGYKSKYQDKKSISDFIPGHAAVASGGIILERMYELEKRMKTRATIEIGIISAAIGVLFTAAVFASDYLLSSASEARQLSDQAKLLNDSTQKKAELLDKKLIELESRKSFPGNNSE